MCVFAFPAWRIPKVSSHVNSIEDFGAPKSFLHPLFQESLTLLKELKAKLESADLHNAKRVAPGTQCTSLEGRLSPSFHRVPANLQEPFTTSARSVERGSQHWLLNKQDQGIPRNQYYIVSAIMFPGLSMGVWAGYMEKIPFLVGWPPPSPPGTHKG